MIYLLSLGVLAFVAARMMPKLDKNTIYDFCNFCGDICCKNMKRQPVIFYSTDSSEILVQTDESDLGKKDRNITRGSTMDI